MLFVPAVVKIWVVSKVVLVPLFKLSLMVDCSLVPKTPVTRETKEIRVIVPDRITSAAEFV